VLHVDLSIQASGLTTSRVYSNSGKIRVGWVLGSGEIQAGVFRFYGFLVYPTGLEFPFRELFFFCQNQKIRIFITQNYQYLTKKHSNYNFLKEYYRFSNFSLWYMNVMYGGKESSLLRLHGPVHTLKQGQWGWVIYGATLLENANGSRSFGPLITHLIIWYFC